MDILKKLESDERILNELKDLLRFAPPVELRQSLEHTFFHIFMEEDLCLPNQKQIVAHYYYLINFLNEVERKLTD